MVCQVDSHQTAIALREAAIAAGMMARIDQSGSHTWVSIDHPDHRRASAANLVKTFRSIPQPGDPADGLGLAAQTEFDIALGYLAETRGISIEEAQTLLSSQAEPANAPVHEMTPFDWTHKGRADGTAHP